MDPIDEDLCCDQKDMSGDPYLLGYLGFQIHQCSLRTNGIEYPSMVTVLYWPPNRTELTSRVLVYHSICPNE